MARPTTSAASSIARTPLGLGVILDVVYNHLGPDGNYLNDFSPDYFTDKYSNDWGRAINFEGPAPARALFVENAGYWIDEFHFDGLRLDATQDVHDASPEHVIASIVRRAREAAGRRVGLRRRRERAAGHATGATAGAGGYGVDALWNDDYHHTRCRRADRPTRGVLQRLHRLAPGVRLEREIRVPVSGAVVRVAEAAAWDAGARSARRAASSATSRTTTRSPTARSASGCISCRRPRTLPCADGADAAGAGNAVAVPGAGVRRRLRRSCSSRTTARACAMPSPMGRREFLSQFPSTADPEVRPSLPPPGDPATFDRCKLDSGERERHADAYALHRDLLAAAAGGSGDRRGSVRGDRRARCYRRRVFVLRYGGASRGRAAAGREPGRGLRAGRRCRSRCSRRRPAATGVVQWSSEAVRYGGNGCAAVHAERRVPLPRRVRDAPARRAAIARGGVRMTMDAGLTRVITTPRDAAPGEAEPMPRREWLVTNGLGGYSSGTVAGRGDAPVSRPARGGPAGAARAHRDAEPPAGAGPAAVARRRCGSATRTKWPVRTRPTAPIISSSSGWSWGCRSGVTRLTATRSRSAC